MSLQLPCVPTPATARPPAGAQPRPPAPRLPVSIASPPGLPAPRADRPHPSLPVPVVVQGLVPSLRRSRRPVPDSGCATVAPTLSVPDTPNPSIRLAPHRLPSATSSSRHRQTPPHPALRLLPHPAPHARIPAPSPAAHPAHPPLARPRALELPRSVLPPRPPSRPGPPPSRATTPAPPAGSSSPLPPRPSTFDSPHYPCSPPSRPPPAVSHAPFPPPAPVLPRGQSAHRRSPRTPSRHVPGTRTPIIGNKSRRTHAPPPRILPKLRRPRARPPPPPPPTTHAHTHSDPPLRRGSRVPATNMLRFLHRLHSPPRPRPRPTRDPPPPPRTPPQSPHLRAALRAARFGAARSFCGRGAPRPSAYLSFSIPTPPHQAPPRPPSPQRARHQRPARPPPRPPAAPPARTACRPHPSPPPTPASPSPPHQHPHHERAHATLIPTPPRTPPSCITTNTTNEWSPPPRYTPRTTSVTLPITPAPVLS